MVIERPKITCLFVHGWGMNRTIWQPVIEQLPPWIRAECMDLPGHGERTIDTLTDLTTLVDDIKSHCECLKKTHQPLVVIAWSLGALPCLQLCIEGSNDIDGLMLVNTTPCFVMKDDWPQGVEAAVFDDFARALKREFAATIRRFLSLQVKGSASSRSVLRELRDTVVQQPAPDNESLDAGLMLLKEVDLRKQLMQISQPVCWLLGERDSLVKQTLEQELTNLMPDAGVTLFKGAGHAIFLSHTENFVEKLTKFLHTFI